MQKISLVVIILVGLTATVGCMTQEPGSVNRTPAEVTTAPIASIPATPGTEGTSPVIPGTSVPVPGVVLPGELVLTPPGPYHSGDRIKISANTILSPGNPILVEVVSAGFHPTDKMNDTRFYGTSAVVYVEKGVIESDNYWSYQLDTTGYGPGLYQVEVSAVLVKGYRLSSSFTLLP